MEFSPNAKFSFDFTKRIAGGLEYYAAYGPLTGFDPVREQQQQFVPAIDVDFGPRWEFNFGAGVGVTNLAAPTAWKPYLACVVDLELKRTSGWTPAIQVGLGGGTRVGLGLRRSTGRWR